ncbi:MAG: ABC-2 family transporter protein [Candidatus Levybacteria bacterium]|nr:ABC-2 family transporter protein [Candidatus Levybacteria bacterium]
MKKYLKIWWLLTVRSSQVAFISRLGAFLFIIGKILRFLFFLLFLLILQQKTKAVGGYSLWQIIFFFVTFNLVDSLTQFFLREVYRFRTYVTLGYFDYILTKPFSSLFRSLFGGSDILDLAVIIISISFIIFSAGKLGAISLIGVFFYIALVINAFLIGLSFHIVALSIGVLTTEVDNTIMLFRDVTQVGRVPIDIYKEPIRSFFTFAIPVGIMMTFPAKAMLGFLSSSLIVLSFIIGLSALSISILFWRFSLRYYSSASS